MADQDDEFLLDAPDAVPSETSAVQPAEGDTEMTVDEEGRPKFPAAKNTVWISISISKSSTVLKKKNRMDHDESKPEKSLFLLTACLL
jgi:hypothetical protein